MPEGEDTNIQYDQGEMEDEKDHGIDAQTANNKNMSAANFLYDDNPAMDVKPDFEQPALPTLPAVSKVTCTSFHHPLSDWWIHHPKAEGTRSS